MTATLVSTGAAIVFGDAELKIDLRKFVKAIRNTPAASSALNSVSNAVVAEAKKNLGGGSVAGGSRNITNSADDQDPGDGPGQGKLNPDKAAVARTIRVKDIQLRTVEKSMLRGQQVPVALVVVNSEAAQLLEYRLAPGFFRNARNRVGSRSGVRVSHEGDRE